MYSNSICIDLSDEYYVHVGGPIGVESTPPPPAPQQPSQSVSLDQPVLGTRSENRVSLLYKCTSTPYLV